MQAMLTKELYANLAKTPSVNGEAQVSAPVGTQASAQGEAEPPTEPKESSESEEKNKGVEKDET
jgi:hypothetical protein